MRGQVSRWGNSLGVRIPSDVAKKVGLSDGTKVEIEAQNGEVVIKLAEPANPYTLSGLLAGFTPQLREELRTLSDGGDFGADVDREIVEE